MPNATIATSMANDRPSTLIGQFDHEDLDYDGPGDAVDGVGDLERKHYCFSTSTGGSDRWSAALPAAGRAKRIVVEGLNGLGAGSRSPAAVTPRCSTNP